jgi:membrane-associated phospholipid phosphatase
MRRATCLMSMGLILVGAVARADDALPPEPKVSMARGRNDQRRTMRSYGRNLWGNVLGVPKSANHRSLLILGALAAPSFAWDEEVVGYFERHPNQQFADIGQAMGGAIAIGGVGLGLFAIGRVSHGDRFRAMTYDLSQAIIVTQVYTTALKLAVRRERPDGSNQLSFPSGHASNAFTFAGVVGKHYGPRAEAAGYVVASYIALSRCAANKHHFSDTFAGAGLGLIIGRSVARRNGRPPGSADGTVQRSFEVAFAPSAGPSGDGSGLVLRVAF